MSDYRVVTVTNRIPQEWYYLQKEFFQSLGEVKPLIITGGGNEYGQWGGLTSKPKWLYKAIKDGHIPQKYMIFPDNWDLVFACPIDEVMEVYKACKKTVMISAETNCFPSDTKEEYDKLHNPPPYKYLNSGFIIGETEAILTCLESMDLPNVPNDYHDAEKGIDVNPNDQLLWQLEYLKQPVEIGLDCNQFLSQTLHDARIDDFDFSTDRIVNKITGSAPCSFHFNGGAKSNLELRNPILKHLNLLT